MDEGSERDPLLSAALDVYGGGSADVEKKPSRFSRSKRPGTTSGGGTGAMLDALAQMGQQQQQQQHQQQYGSVHRPGETMPPVGAADRLRAQSSAAAADVNVDSQPRPRSRSNRPLSTTSFDAQALDPQSPAVNTLQVPGQQPTPSSSSGFRAGSRPSRRAQSVTFGPGGGPESPVSVTVVGQAAYTEPQLTPAEAAAQKRKRLMRPKSAGNVMDDAFTAELIAQQMREEAMLEEGLTGSSPFRPRSVSMLSNGSVAARGGSADKFAPRVRRMRSTTTYDPNAPEVLAAGAGGGGMFIAPPVVGMLLGREEKTIEREMARERSRSYNSVRPRSTTLISQQELGSTMGNDSVTDSQVDEDDFEVDVEVGGVNMAGKLKLLPVMLCFFFLGLSAFVVPEAIVIQAAFFSKCLGYGADFYIIAVGALFIPSLLTQLLQNHWDIGFDKRFGSVVGNTTRVVIGNIGQLACIIVLLVTLHEYHAWDYSTPSDTVAYQHKIILLCVAMGLQGIFVSMAYGTYSQSVSYFPERCHGLFFMGTMTVFVILIPINAGAGTLCKTNPPGSLHMFEPNWEGASIYFLFACIINVGGLIAYIVLTQCTNAGSFYFTLKDQQLQENTELEKLLKTGQKKNAFIVDQALITTLIGSYIPSYWQVIQQIWPQMLLQMVTLVSSLMTSSQYPRLPTDQISQMPTIMFYDYYAMQFVGMWMTLPEKLRRMDQRILLTMTFLRAAGVIAILYYVNCWIVFENSDVAVIILYSIFMIFGGYLFAVAFSQAASKFEGGPSRSRVATIMNVCYFSAVIIAVTLTLTASSLMPNQCHALPHNGTNFTARYLELYNL